MGKIKVDTYTGTGAAINISLGFTPDYVRIVNVTDGDIAWEWFRGLGAGDAFQGTNHAATQFSLITSNGVDAYAGSSTSGSEAAEGFTVGTSLSESAKVFRYVAIQGDDGGAG